MGTIEIGRSTLYYESHGSGPPVVFVHGMGGNHASWYAQVRVFSARYTAIAFDQRGFGKSTDVEQLGRDAMTDDLERLLDELKLDSVTLVAQSMGGGPCIGITCRSPERVRCLVLADTLIGLELPPEHERIMAGVRAATANLSQVERVIGVKTRERDPDRTFLYSQIASFNTSTLKTLKGTFPLYALGQLAATAVPILFVVGEDDVLVPPAVLRAVQAQIPNSELYEIADVGHSANFEAPAAFNARVLAFLDERMRM